MFGCIKAKWGFWNRVLVAGCRGNGWHVLLLSATWGEGIAGKGLVKQVITVKAERCTVVSLLPFIGHSAQRHTGFTQWLSRLERWGKGTPLQGLQIHPDVFSRNSHFWFSQSLCLSLSLFSSIIPPLNLSSACLSILPTSPPLCCCCCLYYSPWTS